MGSGNCPVSPDGLATKSLFSRSIHARRIFAKPALLVFAALVVPSLCPAQSLKSIQRAITAAQIRHTVNYRAGENGKKISEVWASGKLRRLNYGTNTGTKNWAISDGHWIYSFSPEQKLVLMTLDIQTGFPPQDSLPGLARSLEMNRSGVKLRKVNVNGKPVIELTRTGKFQTLGRKGTRENHASKTVWLVDTKDNLPYKVFHYVSPSVKAGGIVKMVLASTGRIDYPKKISAGLFDRRTPAGWRTDAIK